MNKNKFFYTFALLFAASLLFSSCRNNDDDNGNGNGNGNGNNNPGIGNPTATTDPGVLIGSIGVRPIRWATRNVAAPGTFAQNAHDAGMFFQWNRRTGWSATNPMVSSPAGATWDNTNATGETWVRTNDPCPPGWRVPTLAEFDALRNAGHEWTTQSGVNGTGFGSGNNTIFLPAAGARNANGALGNVGTLGWYWSSSPSISTSDALYLFIRQGNSTLHPSLRATGFSVRCVAE